MRPATTLTLASGGSGGIFAPSLFMGATAGAAFGQLLELLSLTPEGSTPASYALVGMAAVVAGTTHAPLTAILILFELSRNIYVVLPIMLAAIVSTIEDMSRWLLLNLNRGTIDGKRIISETQMTELRTPRMVMPSSWNKYPESTLPSYALGWAVGIVLFQTSLQRSRASITAPVANVVGNVFTVVAGMILFGEQLPDDPVMTALRVGGFALTLVVVVLVRGNVAQAEADTGRRREAAVGATEKGTDG